VGDFGAAPPSPLSWGEAVEDPAVGGGASRDGLDGAEVGATQAEADGGVGAVAVGRLEDDQAALGADEGGSGAQQLMEGVVQGVRAGEALGELVEGGQAGDPAGEAVLDGGELIDGADVLAGRCGGRALGRGRGRRGMRGGSVRVLGNRWIDSSHFRQVRGGHGRRLPAPVGDIMCHRPGSTSMDVLFDRNCGALSGGVA
jgi:hypothetical protein